MTLGFNAMVLHGAYTGVHRAGWELLRALAEERSQEIRVYASRAFETGAWAPPNVRVHRTWFPARWRSVRIVYENLFLARRALREGCGLLHCPAYTMPMVNLLPTVVTVHDVIALTHPQLCTKANVAHYKRALPKTVERSHMMIVPSEATRRALLKATAAKPAKVRVVPFGVSELFRPLADSRLLEAFREQFGLREPYVLFVGRLERKKNVETLVKAFFAATMARRMPHRLIIAGPDGTSTRSVAKLVGELAFTERVLRIERVPEESLPLLYAGAACVAMPSIVEGFGFPALEAMACGAPVITSGDRALRELVAPEAPSVAWEDVAGLRQALEMVLTDEQAARQIGEAGLKRAAEFTWGRTAEMTRAVYSETLERYDGIGRGSGKGGATG